MSIRNDRKGASIEAGCWWEWAGSRILMHTVCKPLLGKLVSLMCRNYVYYCPQPTGTFNLEYETFQPK